MVALTGAGAYAAMQAQADKIITSAGKSTISTGADAAAGPGFGDVLKQVLNDAVGQSKNAESAMTAQLQGKGDMVDVVTAVASAQTSVEAMVAVRDQVIAAYQQIMQMPI